MESHSAPPQHQEPLAKAADPNAILTKDPRNGSLPAVDMTARSTIRSSSATAPKGEDARPLPPIRSQEPQTPDAWKARGNDLFKIGQWESAAECYSKGFNLFDLTSPSTSTATLSSAAVVLSNRAMSYLKMKMWTEAEADCTRALELDPGNAKAFHRRGLARKGLSRLEEAMGDFESASRLEPPSQYHVFSHSKQSGPNAAPSSSLSERDSCLSELIEREGLKEEPLKGRAGSKTGANKGKEGIEVVLITTPPSAAEASKGDNTGSAGLDKVIEVGEKKEVEANVHQAEKRAPAAASQTSASAAAAAAAVAAASRSVMMRPPVTSTDFESSWRSFSDDLSLQCSYLNLLVPDQLASVFKSTLTPQTLASILKSLLSGVTFGSIKVNHAVGVIQGLVLIPRFEMTAMSLAGKERTVIKDLWEKVMVTEGGGGLADEALRKKFRV